MRKSILFILLAVLLSGFISLTGFVIETTNLPFDQWIQLYVSQHRTDLMTTVMRIITFFGSQNFLVPAYLVLALSYLYFKKYKSTINVLVIGISSTALLFLLKEVLKRPRPLYPIITGVKGFSFPSGHTFSSFTFLGLCIYLVFKSKLTKPVKVILMSSLFCFAWLIGYSRVYLGVHFASDILAGFILSILWLLTSLAIILNIRAKEKEKPKVRIT